MGQDPQELLDVLGGPAKKLKECRGLPSDLCLLGNQGVLVGRRRLCLESLVLLEALLDLGVLFLL